MDKKLLMQALTKYLLGLIIVSVLLFIPGTLKYWNGWLFIFLLFIPMLLVGIVLLLKEPELLKARLDIKEKEKAQKEVITYSGLMFIIGFIIAGLNYRYKWSSIPNIVIILSSVVFLIAYVLYGETLRENRHLSRTIKVDNNQELIEKGLYKIVRHPMYSITIILFLTIPLILGSIYSFIIFLAYPIIITKRIKNEEEILEKELKGYNKYKNKVKYKLIPFIW